MNQNPYAAAPALRQPDPRGPHQQQPVYPGGAESVVDQNSDFNGRYQTSNNLRVEGRAQGEIRCSGTLLVAEQGKVAATVVAQNVTIAGDFTGDIQCEGRFVLLPTARANGRVRTGSLMIQEGAVFTGEIRMEDPNAPQPRASAPASSRSARNAEKSASGGGAGNGGLNSLLDEPAPNGARSEAGSRTSD
jgi:cytoskeletal protein CcmA (bactofilin family)